MPSVSGSEMFNRKEIHSACLPRTIRKIRKDAPNRLVKVLTGGSAARTIRRATPAAQRDFAFAVQVKL